MSTLERKDQLRFPPLSSKNGMYQRPKHELNVKELGAALLWLRNHFEFFEISDAKDKKLTLKILNAIDIILLSKDDVSSWVTDADMRHFKEKWLDQK